MTKREFNRLDDFLQFFIEDMAEEKAVSLKEYLETTDSRYCILIGNSNGENTKIVNWDDEPFDYLVYDSKEMAENDWRSEESATVITETEAIKILNNNVRSSSKH